MGMKQLVKKLLMPLFPLACVWLVMEFSGVHAKVSSLGADAVEWASKYSSASRKLRGLMVSSTLSEEHGKEVAGRRLQFQIQPNSGVQQQEQEGGGGAGSGAGGRIITQLIYGLIYYCLVVSKYPVLTASDDRSKAREIQSKNECEALCAASCTNIFLSWCCTGPRAAHTLDKTGILNYWISLLAMTFCPQCTLCWANSFTELNTELGGEKRDMCKSLLCACCCTCCVVAQDAQALDDITSVHVGCCGVSQDGIE